MNKLKEEFYRFTKKAKVFPENRISNVIEDYDFDKIIDVIDFLYNKKYIYELTSENLSNLGGPMGTEYTYNNWTKLFYDLDDAKKYAENDYTETIEWLDEKYGFRSPDLGSVMYHIKKKNIQ